MQKSHLQKVQKLGNIKGRLVEKPRIRDTVCDLFHIGHDAYSEIVGGYLHKRKVYVTGRNTVRRGGNAARETRIPRTKAMQVAVRDFVRSQRMNCQRVTACQVLDFFVENKYVIVPLDERGRYEQVAFDSAYRAVRRWLAEFGGYERGKRKGNNLVPSEANVAKKHHYLRTFFANRAKPPGERLREVYTDESYIHEHYHRNEDSLYDPNDEQDVIYQKEKHKGRRYCFCAAIQGPDPHVAEATEAEDLAGLVPGSIWAFCPQKKGDHLGDYHKVFNSDNYIKWFRDQLISNLHQPSLIMLDNAAYHCVHGPDVPQWYRLKRQECIDYLMANGAPFDPAVSATEMKQLVKQYIISNVKIEVERLAEVGGHTILFSTPAYHSDLQPIELVWALVKGNVGRQYSNQTTLDLVYERLMHEFNQLEDRGHRSINGMIEKCASLAAQFHGEIEQEDHQLDDDEPDDGSSDDGQEDPPDPPAATSIDPGEQGGDSSGEEGVIGPFAMV
jgi:hypothetical protein